MILRAIILFAMLNPTVVAAQQYVQAKPFFRDAIPKYLEWMEASFDQRLHDVKADEGEDSRTLVASASWAALLDTQLSDVCGKEVVINDLSHNREQGLSYVAALFNGTLMGDATNAIDGVDVEVASDAWPPARSTNDGIAMLVVASVFGTSLADGLLLIDHGGSNTGESISGMRAQLTADVGLLDCIEVQAGTHAELAPMMSRWNQLERCYALVTYAKRVLNAPIDENVPADWPHVLAEVHQEHMEYLELSTERGECEGIV